MPELSFIQPDGESVSVTAKVGEDLPEGQILAEPGQKGTQRQVLPPGCFLQRQ